MRIIIVVVVVRERGGGDRRSSTVHDTSGYGLRAKRSSIMW